MWYVLAGDSFADAILSPFSSTGVTFGKTPLIKLSPKKTVEGFVGAFICTLIFAVLVRTLSVVAEW